MPIDYSIFKFSKGTPRVVAKHTKDVEHDKKLSKAYAAVNLRDGDICRVTGVKLTPGAKDDKHRREHHHLKGRRVRPEWVYRPERIILVSAYVHKLLQSSALQPGGCDARQPIKFAWNKRVVKKPMFRLREEVAA